MARSWTSCRRGLDAVLAEEPSRLAAPVGGEDIMRVRNIKPGPEVGRIKQRLTELVMDGVIDLRGSLLAYPSPPGGLIRQA